MAKALSGKGLEVHEHCFTRGPRASGTAYKFSHSHEGGGAPHEHPNTGPAAYTIDKDEWLRATGMRGGGRKRYTARPNGEQFALVPREPASSTSSLPVSRRQQTRRKGRASVSLCGSPRRSA